MAYFGYGTRLVAYRAIDNHTYERGGNGIRGLGLFRANAL
jgi:hypothetical protein